MLKQTCFQSKDKKVLKHPEEFFLKSKTDMVAMQLLKSTLFSIFLDRWNVHIF